ITLNNVTPKNRLAYVIPPFMRAVTVAVDPVVGVGGFLKAGDHVDVVATFVQNDASVTKTVLQDVLLLAAGTDLNGTSNNPNQAADQKPQGHATLAVMPPEAERLILADMRGKLRLTLRRPDDISFVSAKGVTGREVIGRVPADNPVLQTMPRFDIASTRAQATKHASEAAKNVPLFAQMQFPPARMQKASVPIMPISDAKTIQIVRGAKIEQVEVAR
ncbi:MAG TPA: Flp pilus assembly protein CpaB, partial [Armatimonadota bacterium]